MHRERMELNQLCDHELVSYWNILQTPVIRGSADKQERHTEIVDGLLTERNIPHERGKRTLLAVA